MVKSSSRRPNQTSSKEIITQFEHGHVALSEALRQLAGESPRSTAPTLNLSREHLLLLLKDLDELVGLEEVKRTIKDVLALVFIQQERARYQLKTEPVVLHMVFKGNPGTGKTTVARLLAKIFQQCGLLTKGHLVEVERADLVGEYIGHTAQKTRELIQKALGGVLFIDEAYSLARGGDKDFGREAIDCLVKGMEDHRNQFIAIIAGYENEMDWFLSTNPGLPSRFPIHLTFPNYDVRALLEIAKRSLAQRQYRLAPDAEYTLRQRIREVLRDPEETREFANARWMRNMMEAAIRRHAARVFQQKIQSRQELMTLSARDFRREDV